MKNEAFFTFCEKKPVTGNSCLRKVFHLWYDETMKKPHYYIPALFILMMIFGFSAQDGSSSGHLSLMVYWFLDRLFHLPMAFPTMHYLIRKCAHMTEFGLLAISLDYGMRHNDVTATIRKAMLLTCLFACLDECHQLFVADRSGQLTDVLIDMLGASLFMTAEVIVVSWWQRKRHSKMSDGRSEGKSWR